MSLRSFRRCSRIRGFTLIELLVVIAIIAILTAMAVPAVQQARETARLTTCRSRLAQIALALQQYDSAFTTLPPGSVNAAGPIQEVAQGYHVAWTVQILPYLDQSNLYRKANFSVGIYESKNTELRQHASTPFLCPSDDAIAGRFGSESNYAGCHHQLEAPINSNNKGLLYLNSTQKISEIPDGAGATFLIGEKLQSEGDFSWASGTRSTLRNTGTPINRKPADPGAVGGFGSRHSALANFATADGSVRSINASINSQTYQRLASRDDGELVGEF